MNENATNTRELLLLGLLRRQEMHGYQLNEFLLGELSTCTNIKKPTAYYLLKKMAAQGWIAETIEQEGNRPLRRVYRITPEGEQAFQRLLRETLPVYTPTYFESDLPLAYLDELRPEEARLLLARRREQLEQARQALEDVPAHAGSVKWLIEHQRRHLQIESELLEEILVQI